MKPLGGLCVLDATEVLAGGLWSRSASPGGARWRPTRAGDDGVVRALDVKPRRPNVFGHVSRCRGRVTGGRIEEGGGLVDLAAWVEDQLGDTTADGADTMKPPRAGGTAR